MKEIKNSKVLSYCTKGCKKQEARKSFPKNPFLAPDNMVSGDTQHISQTLQSFIEKNDREDDVDKKDDYVDDDGI